MTLSPFLPPGPRHSAVFRRRRRRRRLRLGAGASLLLLAAAAAVLLHLSQGGHGRTDNRHRHLHQVLGAGTEKHLSVAAHAPAPPKKLSPAGFPLSAPSFALKGLGAPGKDPVKTRFSHAPRAGILFDLNTGRVLWQLNPRRRLAIASLTKMMTALLVVEHSRPREPAFIAREAVEMPGEALGVLPLHREVPVETLLYGLLLPSANDAAVALAMHVSGTVKAFVKQMNVEAGALGLGCTRFSSPSGYYDAHNFSCPADLAVLAHADLAHPRIARIARTATAVLPFPSNRSHKLYLTNNNPLLLYGYHGATGLKTGYTERAGKCLVATATRHGVSLGVVLLNSPEPGTQASDLLDRAFKDVYGQSLLRDEPPILGGV